MNKEAQRLVRNNLKINLALTVLEYQDRLNNFNNKPWYKRLKYLFKKI